MRSIVQLAILSMVLVPVGNALSAKDEPSTSHKGTRSTKSATPAPNAEPASKPKLDDSASLLGSDLANTVVNLTGDPDDHVRCFFTDKQLADLRPIPSTPHLTEADESRVLTNIIQTAITASNAELTPDQKVIFVHLLTSKISGQLVGKTPGQALATFMDLLYEVKEMMKQTIVGTDATATGSLGKLWTGSSFKTAASSATDTSSLSNVSGPINGQNNAGSGIDQTAPNATETVNAVAATARVAINKIAAPADIGCAFQILSWNQSRLLFGRSVAEDYIAVQITVRNVNPKEEFLVHNAMLSVDTDIHGGMGRYFEGADKFSVEAYNTAGEPLTPRGKVGNSIVALNTLLSVLQPVVNATNFSNAVAAFTGGVVPGFKTVSPDHQKEQLLLIANSGFSASDTKTVVGRSSSSTFYTWFPAKPFLEGWWVQECAKNVDSVDPMRQDPENAITSPAPGSGVDLVRARYACKASEAKTWNTIPYKKWSSIADDLFRNLSYAVVAGIHVQEDKKNLPSITDVKCPTNDKGNIDLSKASSNGTLSCTITGENLVNVRKLRLENKADAVDPVRPEANVDPEDTSGSATFTVKDLWSATGSVYAVYFVTKDGTETPTGTPPLHLDPTAISLTGDSNSGELDLAKLPANIALSGYHLDMLTKVCFTSGSPTDAKSITADATSNSAIKATVDLKPIGHVAPGTWTIYPADCASNPKSGSISIKITDSTPPPASPTVKPPAPKVKAAPKSKPAAAPKPQTTVNSKPSPAKPNASSPK